MKNTKILVGAVLAITVASGSAFAGKSTAVELEGQSIAVPAVTFDLSAVVPAQAVAAEAESYETARLTRAERRARREARRAARAERRAARAARANRGGGDTGAVNAPFGFLADGVTPRTQPITRSDIRLRENGGVLRAADSFFNENRR